MRSRYFAALGPTRFHRVHYTQWGDPANPRVVVCVHGLTQTGRDFDPLASALSDGWRVICPDVVGRGRSDWLDDGSGYTYPQYLADMTVLIALAGVEKVDWVGTSMGGLIGMLLAALPGSPIRRLVLNDVGPLVPKQALERIAGYVGRDERFATFEDFVAAYRERHRTSVELPEPDWSELARHNHRVREDGSFGYGFDPAIAQPFQGMALADVDLWATYDAVRCPTFVIRGADSDVLLAPTVKEMRRRGPRAAVFEVPNVGHVPRLGDAAQIDAIREFLAK